MNEQQPERRRFQFSLRTLLLAVLVVSLPCSWFAVRMERAKRQREAVDAIEKAWCDITYDDRLSNSAEPPVPQWARSLLGDDFFFDVVQVRCIGGNFSDDEAGHLEALTNVTFLELGGTQITDAGLEHLEGLASLDHLTLYSTSVTDTGLEHLEGLASLVTLHLARTRVTETGLEHLEGLTNLTDLNISYTPVTDAGLEHLKGLAKLEKLNLTDTQVTPEGVKNIQRALPECDIVY